MTNIRLIGMRHAEREKKNTCAKLGVSLAKPANQLGPRVRDLAPNQLFFPSAVSATGWVT